MKNIHVLPTDIFNQIGVDHYGKTPTQIKIAEFLINKNIYITSDEEIKKGDWFLEKAGRQYPIQWNGIEKLNFHCKKIILTDNKDLIKDGVQAIDDEFLEWFVKNPSCEEVEIEYQTVDITKKGEWIYNYKIIIPKEESKQETLEEAKAQAWIDFARTNKDVDMYSFVIGYDKGVKLRQEQDKKMYSEEELPTEVDSILAKITHQNDLGLSQWYEVVYYDNKWCSYSGSKTFEDGERVVGWKYCKDLI